MNGIQNGINKSLQNDTDKQFWKVPAQCPRCSTPTYEWNEKVIEKGTIKVYSALHCESCDFKRIDF